MTSDLSGEGLELLALRPDPDNIADALQGIEAILSGMRWDGRRWNLTEDVKRIIGANDPETAFTRFLSVRRDLQLVLKALRSD